MPRELRKSDNDFLKRLRERADLATHFINSIVKNYLFIIYENLQLYHRWWWCTDETNIDLMNPFSQSKTDFSFSQKNYPLGREPLFLCLERQIINRTPTCRQN